MKKSTNRTLENKNISTTITGVSHPHPKLLFNEQKNLKGEQKYKNLEKLIRNHGETELPQTEGYYERIHNNIMAQIILESEPELTT